MTVTVAVDELLHRCLPPGEIVESTVPRVSLLVAGLEHPVVVRSLGPEALHVVPVRGARLHLVADQLLVLRIVLGDGATRVDLAVEVMTSSAEETLLRIHAAPLVLRRRMVRDRALEEALSSRESVRRRAAAVA
jgi:hypothetical protein